MDHGPSRETVSRSATQEFSKIVWNPKVHYRVYKILPLVPILSQSIPPHNISLRSILILSYHLRLGLSMVSFLLTFPPKSYMHSSSPHACYMPCTSHSLNLIVLIILGEEYKLWSSHCAVFSILLSLHPSSVQIFSSAPCSQTSSVHD
jgi:hypothetical protein